MFGKREKNGKCSKILKTDECGKECITFLCTILVHYLETFKIMTKILNNLNNQVTEFVTRSLRALILVSCLHLEISSPQGGTKPCVQKQLQTPGLPRQDLPLIQQSRVCSITGIVINLTKEEHCRTVAVDLRVYVEATETRSREAVAPEFL